MPTIERTLQESIDYAVEAIVKQGERCMEGTGCRYGDKDGNHCFIGHLLDPDDADLMRLQMRVGKLITDHKDQIPTVIVDNQHLFHVLQHFHDDETADARRVHLEDAIDRAKEAELNLSFDNPCFMQWVDMGV